MMPLVVKEADLNRIEVPEDYEILDVTALGRRLGFKRVTVSANLSRRNFGRIPRSNRLPTALDRYEMPVSVAVEVGDR